jgi:Flp pilus assembly protein TadD
MVQDSQDPPKGIGRPPHPPPPEPALIPPPKDDNARARRPRRLAEGRKSPTGTDAQNQLGPARSGGLLAEARARIVDGKFAEAREIASRALVAGGGGDAHLLLGIINQFQGRFVDAERELVQASGIEAQQHLVAVRKVLEDLKAEDQ